MATANPTYNPPRGSAPVVIDVTFAASLTLDMSRAVYPEFRIGVLSANIAIAFSNGFNGQQARVRTTQAASGGPFTITWDSTCIGSDDLALPSASTTASRGDLFGVSVDTDHAKPYQISASNKGRA